MTKAECLIYNVIGELLTVERLLVSEKQGWEREEVNIKNELKKLGLNGTCPTHNSL